MKYLGRIAAGLILAVGLCVGLAIAQNVILQGPQSLNLTGATFTTATLNGTTTVGGPTNIAGTTTLSGQLITTYGTPTITSGACGTTTNGVITSGTNQSGLVTIGAAATTTCTINFSTTLAAAPGACVVFPASAGAAATGTTVAYVSAITTGHFVITGSALASTAYYYLCI
jgi:hypothetical protein